MAWSRVSAMCIAPSTRQVRRSGAGRSCRSACSSTTPHAWPMAANPSATDIDSDRSDTPCCPASRGPEGVTIAATAISGCGLVYGRTWRRASRIVNQSVSRSTGSSLRNRARMASSDSSIIRRCSTGSMPITNASLGSAPGPAPKMVRPRVRWSSSTQRSAASQGWWYGREVTPVPSRMCLVRSAAAAMKISGEAMISYPPEWCSPNHASSNPSRSRATVRSRSYSRASVGLWPTGWKGAKKTPKRMGQGAGISAPVAADVVEEADEGLVHLTGGFLLDPVAGVRDDDVAPMVLQRGVARPGRRHEQDRVQGAAHEQRRHLHRGPGQLRGGLPVAAEVAVPVEAAGEAGAADLLDVVVELGGRQPGRQGVGLGHPLDEPPPVVGEHAGIGGRFGSPGRAGQHAAHGAGGVGAQLGVGDARLLEVEDVEEVVADSAPHRLDRSGAAPG